MQTRKNLQIFCRFFPQRVSTTCFLFSLSKCNKYLPHFCSRAAFFLLLSHITTLDLQFNKFFIRKVSYCSERSVLHIEFFVGRILEMTDWSSFTPTDQSRKHRQALKIIYNPAILFKINVKFSCLIFNIVTFCKSVNDFFLFSIQTKYFPQRNFNSDLLLNSNPQDQLRRMPLKATNLLWGIPVLTNLKHFTQVFSSTGSFVCHSLKMRHQKELG